MSLGRSEAFAVAPASRRLLRALVETREVTLAILILAIVAGMSLADFTAIVIGMTPTAIIAVPRRRNRA